MSAFTLNFRTTIFSRLWMNIIFTVNQSPKTITYLLTSNFNSLEVVSLCLFTVLITAGPLPTGVHATDTTQARTLISENDSTTFDPDSPLLRVADIPVTLLPRPWMSSTR